MNNFIGKNYTVPQLDLSVKPENTVEKYAYLYEQTVVDDSESYLGHPDSVLYIPTVTARAPFSIK